MREIKFRAWDKNLNIMISPFSLFSETLDNYGKGYIERYFEIMQFTGLLDKNGKEIYSGDLLRHNEGSKSYEVMWNGYGFWELDGSCLGMVMRDNPNGLEIVGNIYELLK